MEAGPQAEGERRRDFATLSLEGCKCMAPEHFFTECSLIHELLIEVHSLV